MFCTHGACDHAFLSYHLLKTTKTKEMKKWNFIWSTYYEFDYKYLNIDHSILFSHLIYLLLLKLFNLIIQHNIYIITMCVVCTSVFIYMSLIFNRCIFIFIFIFISIIANIFYLLEFFYDDVPILRIIPTYVKCKKTWEYYRTIFMIFVRARNQCHNRLEKELKWLKMKTRILNEKCLPPVGLSWIRASIACCTVKYCVKY